MEIYLKAFEEQIKPISIEQAQILLFELQRQLLLQEAYFKRFIKQSLLTNF